MKPAVDPLAQLAEIRSIMERSSRFISLSGLSGIGAGVVALAGAGLGHWYLHRLLGGSLGTSQYGSSFGSASGLISLLEESPTVRFAVLPFLLVLCLGIIVLAGGVAVFFTRRRTRHVGGSLWDGVARRLFWSMALPLVAGGLFCLQLYLRGAAGLVVPGMLIFYGVALLNASKYTLPEIKLLGISQIVLGLVASLAVNWAFLFFAAGFGLCHIGYGLLMYNRYERESNVAPSK
ncbi:hypothetical protein [Solirubrum puertoriconensis]|uniref:Uncharacterized protein n=1 Tax=Solirubrum puertoriconensis TaxID=1751427 RepID=A0A9X0HIT7_SOLP1|nr:hypothetical protein [Solirubrum puertoriconensis]KUG06690.1 hypothetical protein ASU33_04960 [Solirubrum puertoriconensis]